MTAREATLGLNDCPGLAFWLQTPREGGGEMADVDERLSELQKKVEAERKQEAELGKEIDGEAGRIDQPPAPPDHARDGGVF